MTHNKPVYNNTSPHIPAPARPSGLGQTVHISLCPSFKPYAASIHEATLTNTNDQSDMCVSYAPPLHNDLKPLKSWYGQTKKNVYSHFDKCRPKHHANHHIQECLKFQFQVFI